MAVPKTETTTEITPTTWEDAAEQAVATIWAMKRRKPRTDVDQLRADLDGFIDSMFHAPSGYARAQTEWSIIGGGAVEMAAEGEYEYISAKTVHATLIRKQADYGHENIRRFGRQGLLVRLHDKVARLENLLATNAEPHNESIEDTLLDIIGYAAIGIMWERQQFMLPLTIRRSRQKN